MLSYHDALQIIRDTASSIILEAETIPLESALGRVCAKLLLSPLDIQPFDNSAMDGFAIKLDDLAGASPERPVRLKIKGVIPAGHPVKDNIVEAGFCWRIMTGAPLPQGVDAIVPIEDVHQEAETVLFKNMPKPGQHIRRTGEDFKKGTSVLSVGDRITQAHMIALASLGISKLRVFKKPKALFISTGDELVDDLSQPLQDGQIYNSNKTYAHALLPACGAILHGCNTIQDDKDIFLETLNTADKKGINLIISSGAVSAGNYDFVRNGLESFGAKILYHKIKLKPGKPNLFAILPSGCLYFGLPGNPVATVVGLRFFVLEALRTMLKEKSERPIFARVMNEFPKKPGLHMILKGRLEYKDDGSVNANVLDGQESFMVSPFLSMNGWLHVPENKENIKTGDVIEAYPAHPYGHLV